MDGYAVGGPEGPWQIVGEVAAGQWRTDPLRPCEAVRIFTGAAIPRCTFSVVPQEDAQVTDGVLVATCESGRHIRRRGEEVSAGGLVVPAGRRVTPPVTAALASLGLAQVEVARRPQVAVLTSGDEVKTPGETLAPGEIYNSNTAAITQTLAFLGIASHSDHIPDREDSAIALITEARATSELLVTTGGVSVGDYDLLPATMERLGYQTIFHGVAIKPGKPIAFAVHPKGGAWFGLPGNPLSTWAGLLLFVLTYLGEELPRMTLPLAEEWRRKPGREEFVPCTRQQDGVRLGRIVGSHANLGLLSADGLAQIPADTTQLSAGDQVHIWRLPWRPE